MRNYLCFGKFRLKLIVWADIFIRPCVYNKKSPCTNCKGINFLMIVFSLHLMVVSASYQILPLMAVSANYPTLPLMAVSANRTYNHTKHSERYCSPLLLYIKDTNMSSIFKNSRCGRYRSGCLSLSLYLRIQE